MPFRVGLLRKFRLKYLDYVFPPFLSTFLNALIVGASTREKINRNAADISICPDLSSFRSLKIDFLKSEELIELGYQTTLQQLKKYKHD